MTRRPLRILFDANPLMTQRTGVGYYTAGLIESLAAARPETQFIGYFYNFLGRKSPPATPTAPNITYRPIYHLPGPVVNLLRRFNLEVPVEVLAATTADFVIYPNFLGQPSLSHIPSAAIVHDLMYFDHPEWGSDKNVRDLQRFMPRTLRRADLLITASNFTTRRLVEAYGVATDKILKTFIPPVAITTIDDTRAQKLRDKQGIDKPYLLYVGTLEPRKNLINLLDAYALLPKAVRHQYSLVFAGKTDWKFSDTMQKLEALQAQGHDIKYLGYVDNDTRAALYQGARLSIQTSHYEGFGMQLLESMQYGVPVAVSDIPVFREVGGDMGAYFNHLDPHDIARVLADCLQQPAPSPDSLRNYVAEQPGWQPIAHTILERFDTILAKGK